MSEQHEAGFFDRNGVKIILGIAGIIGIIVFLSKMFGKSETDKKTQSSRDKEYKKIPPSYPDYVYSYAAEALAGALAEGMTEDEDIVYLVFQDCKNISDVNKIIEFYDTHRVATEIGGSSLPNTIFKLFSPAEKRKLNKILSDKGIAYKFR